MERINTYTQSDRVSFTVWYVKEQSLIQFGFRVVWYIPDWTGCQCFFLPSRESFMYVVVDATVVDMMLFYFYLYCLLVCVCMYIFIYISNYWRMIGRYPFGAVRCNTVRYIYRLSWIIHCSNKSTVYVTHPTPTRTTHTHTHTHVISILLLLLLDALWSRSGPDSVYNNILSVWN